MEQKTGSAWLSHFASSRGGEYALSVMLSVAGVTFSVVPYFFMAQIIQNLMSGVTDRAFYLSKCTEIAICWILRYLLHSLSTTASHHATFRVLSNIRTALLEKLSHIPLGTVMEKSSGSLKNTICERVDSVETTLAHIVPEFTSNVLGAIAVLAYIFVIDWRMGLISLVTVPVGLTCFSFMMMGAQTYFKNTVDKTKILNDTAVEYINGIEVIKAFGKSKSSYGKFVKAAREGADCFIDWMAHSNFSMTSGMAVFPATLIGVLPLGVHFVMNGTLTGANLIFIIILSFGVMTPLLTVFSYMDDLSQIGVIMNEIAGILNEKELARPKSTEALPSTNEIVLESVHFSYKDTEVLHGISMKIKAGTVNALVGPSGSGKSTIAKLIASLWDVDSGAITIGGVNVKDIPLSEYSKYIAYVSQDNYLFDMSVKENVRIAKPDATDEEIIDACKKCGCHDFIMSLENGYDTIVGGAGGHLSGGERQRVSIARAMLKDAPIVILDEATSYTDPENEAVIQSAIARLVQGKTLLVIAHRLSTISDSDCIFVVNDGKIEAQGTQAELLENCGLYRDMWNAHISAKDE